jgi:hypothetical protein
LCWGFFSGFCRYRSIKACAPFESLGQNVVDTVATLITIIITVVPAAACAHSPFDGF